MPDRDSNAFSLQDPLNPLGQDLAALTTRQVLLRADAYGQKEGNRDDDQAVPAGSAAVVELQDPLRSLGLSAWPG